MDTIHLRLEFPPQNDIYFNSTGDSYSRPISASAVFTSHTETEISGLSRLRICLVRVFSSTGREGINGGECVLSRLNRWLSPGSKSSAPYTTRLCSIIEELTLHVPLFGTDSQVGYSPEEGKIYKIPFYMPISASIPPTSATVLGHISYFLVASLSTADGEISSTSQEIRFSRRIIPEHRSMQHTRIYPNSKLVTKVILTQDMTSMTRTDICLDAKVFVRPATSAERSTEYNCVAVRGIRWRIEEVTKLFHQPEYQDSRLPEYQPVEDQSSIREIYNGFQKGYWRTRQDSITTDNSTQDKDSLVEIPLDIVLPRGTVLTPEVDLGCYSAFFRPTSSLPSSLQNGFFSTTQQKIMLTIEHRLKLDILTTEDTFSVYNHDLVDRKPPRIALNACFPLQIVDKAEGDTEEVLSQGNPPRYEEIPVSPPSYENHLQ